MEDYISIGDITILQPCCADADFVEDVSVVKNVFGATIHAGQTVIADFNCSEEQWEGYAAQPHKEISVITGISIDPISRTAIAEITPVYGLDICDYPSSVSVDWATFEIISTVTDVSLDPDSHSLVQTVCDALVIDVFDCSDENVMIFNLISVVTDIDVSNTDFIYTHCPIYTIGEMTPSVCSDVIWHEGTTCSETASFMAASQIRGAELLIGDD